MLLHHLALIFRQPLRPGIFGRHLLHDDARVHDRAILIGHALTKALRQLVLIATRRQLLQPGVG